MKNKIIVDIDGTICKMGERKKYLLEKPIDWDAFYELCFDDKPVVEIINMIEELYLNGYDIIFCTGRSERIREKTIQWLNKHFLNRIIENSLLLMRADNDHRPDTEVKLKLIAKECIDLGSVAFVLEDRKCCVGMWRKMGLICFQVADGDF